MNARDHYREAERLCADHLFEMAQVHAILALAAATGCVGNEGERRAWLDVTDDDAARAVRA